MLVSKGSMLSSKGNMLSCMILLAIEVDTHVQLVARIRHHAVSRSNRARLHALVHYFTRDLNLMLADISPQSTLMHANSMIFPNIRKMLVHIMILPVTSCEAERSFSTLHRIKSYLRTTMANERL